MPPYGTRRELGKARPRKGLKKGGACLRARSGDLRCRDSTTPLGPSIFGTFSKVLFPAMRLAYLVAPQDLIDGFLLAKAITDRHSPTVEQAALAES